MRLRMSQDMNITTNFISLNPASSTLYYLLIESFIFYLQEG